MTEQAFSFHPLTPERWQDFEKLFGPRGAYGGCWCMYWRLARSQFSLMQGEGNRVAMLDTVWREEIPGILAYHDGEAVGWCSVAPRQQFASLERSRVLKRLDDRPVWSIVCFYVDKRWRGQGLVVQLIAAAVDFVRQQGGKIVEAYPTIPRRDWLPPVSIYMGLPIHFERAGFVRAAQPSASKLIMRYTILD